MKEQQASQVEQLDGFLVTVDSMPEGLHATLEEAKSAAKPLLHAGRAVEIHQLQEGAPWLTFEWDAASNGWKPSGSPSA